MQKDIGYQTEYKTKLTYSHTAVEQIGSDSAVGIGQAACQPPALMQALAQRAEAGNVDNVKVYHMHSEGHMKNSLLRYELMGRIKPYCMFMQAIGPPGPAGSGNELMEERQPWQREWSGKLEGTLVNRESVSGGSCVSGEPARRSKAIALGLRSRAERMGFAGRT